MYIYINREEKIRWFIEIRPTEIFSYLSNQAGLAGYHTRHMPTIYTRTAHIYIQSNSHDIRELVR
jgi:hypothetical protein